MAKITIKELWKMLLKDVDDSGILPSDKPLDSLEPMIPLKDVLEEYRELKKEDDFDIAAFIDTYYDVKILDADEEE